MGEMEDAVLKNSKGATYMSFVLDVEVILKKKKGAQRGNLAQSKVRNESQVPTKTEQEDKIVKQPEENENITNPPSEKDDITPPPPEKKEGITMSPPDREEDVKVYAATLEPTDIFLEQGKGLKKIKSSEPLEDDNPTINVVKKHSIKKKMKKINQKSKVFKGKIEKVDFLECNRIFMCNYLKIQNNKPHNTKSQIKPNTNDINCKIMTEHESTFKTIGLVDDIEKSPTLKKKDTFSFLVAEVIPQRNYSTGDFMNGNPEAGFRNLSVAGLNRRANVKKCLSSGYYKTVNISSSRRQKYFYRHNFSCQNVVSENEQYTDKVIKRSKSLPSRYFLQELNEFKTSHEDTKKSNVFNFLHGVRNKISVEPNILNQRANVFSKDEIYKDSFNLEVKFFHNSERIIKPHTHRVTRLKCTSKNVKLKRVNSTCEISHVTKQCIILRSKSLDHVHRFYKDNNSKILTFVGTNNDTNVPQGNDKKLISKSKFKKKQSIWKTINSYIFECVIKK
uniref:Uncharacterized protein n=1 Tax=Homalodisca liturata TaxID=320908 RepID=A0A1B6HJX0_9HEMI